jgi:hypothetical protein
MSKFVLTTQIQLSYPGGSRAGLITMRYGRTTGASAVTAGVNIAGWAMSCSFRKTSWYLMGS